PPLRQQGASVCADAAADIEDALREDRETLPEEPEDQLTPSGEPEMVPFDLVQTLQAVPPKFRFGQTDSPLIHTQVCVSLPSLRMKAWNENSNLGYPKTIL